MKKWLTLEEMLEAPTQVCRIFEPIDFTVDFVVKEETAEARARRRWRMPEEGKG